MKIDNFVGKTVQELIKDKRETVYTIYRTSFSSKICFLDLKHRSVFVCEENDTCRAVQ